MKLVIQTQYTENYGAHDWNGEGECPQYWKFKGGSTYVIENVDVDEASHISCQVTPLIEYADYGSKEYVLDSTLEADDAVVCEEWESPWILQRNGYGVYVASRKAFGGNEIESYVMMPGGERTEYIRYMPTLTTIPESELVA